MKRPVLLLLLALAAAGCRKEAPPPQNQIAVTNSYMECAVGDLCPQIKTVCLTPPGMCPGHFDILPSSAEQLRQCRLLLRFDFQSGMDGQMQRFAENGLQIRQVVSPPGMCIPATYVKVCRQVQQAVGDCFPDKRDELERRMQDIVLRMEALEQSLQSTARSSGFDRIHVICSSHQSEFAKALGLRVVSTFLGRDLATPANMGQCLSAVGTGSIHYVIANQQEGTELAEVLAGRLNAKVVVFSNFPDTAVEAMNFDGMVLENLARLQKKGAM